MITFLHILDIVKFSLTWIHWVCIISTKFNSETFKRRILQLWRERVGIYWEARQQMICQLLFSTFPPLQRSNIQASQCAPDTDPSRFSLISNSKQVGEPDYQWLWNILLMGRGRGSITKLVFNVPCRRKCWKSVKIKECWEM